MSSSADPSVFEHESRDISLTEDDLLGTHVFEDVLFTGTTESADTRTGRTPSHMDRSVEEAKAYVQKHGEHSVAMRLSVEKANEIGSPYVAGAFFHFDITGSLAWHTVFRQATESDAYNVEYTADYESGDLTISVQRS